MLGINMFVILHISNLKHVYCASNHGKKNVMVIIMRQYYIFSRLSYFTYNEKLIHKKN